MKRAWIGWIALLLITLSASYVNACSGYVVYSNETLYGMNYDDYAGPEMKFTILKEGNTKFFLLYFEQGGIMCTVTGMNNHGCFMSLQMDYPNSAPGKSTKPSMILPNAVLRYLQNGTSLAYIEKLVKENYMINPPGWSLHSLLADITGRAMILEVGAKDNVVIPNQNNFHVMTNFHNRDFLGKDYRAIQAPSADRYKSIYKTILEKMGHFNFDIGFNMLKGAATSDTQASMLYYPKKGEIYLALHHDYTRIWKISLAKETLETYRGFKTAKKITLDEDGITGTELSKWK